MQVRCCDCYPGRGGGRKMVQRSEDCLLVVLLNVN